MTQGGALEVKFLDTLKKKGYFLAYADMEPSIIQKAFIFGQWLYYS